MNIISVELIRVLELSSYKLSDIKFRKLSMRTIDYRDIVLKF